MEGEERMWYVAVVSVKPVVSKPAARSMMAVSWRGWDVFSWAGRLLVRYAERMGVWCCVSVPAWRFWSWRSIFYFRALLVGGLLGEGLQTHCHRSNVGIIPRPVIRLPMAIQIQRTRVDRYGISFSSHSNRKVTWKACRKLSLFLAFSSSL